MKKVYSLLLSSIFSIAAFSQLSFNNGSSTYTQNFNTLGTSATATLPANFTVGTSPSARTVAPFNTSTNMTMFSAGANMSSTATPGIYNYGAGDPAVVTDRAVGGLGGGTVQSVNLYLRLANNGTTAVNNFAISYDVEKYRRGTNAGGASVTLFYSFDGTTFTSAVANGVPAATFAQDVDNNGSAVVPIATTPVTGTLNISLGVGADLYLAWNYSTNTGAFTTNDAIALGIDNISIQANFATALPVTMANFKALQRGQAVELQWSAITESSMASHMIERSANGSAFTSIGTLPAQNNSTAWNYRYTDAAPNQGMNYYRIKSVSRGGDVSYSNILRLNMGFGKTDINVLSNPVINGNVNLQLNNLERGRYAINIFNVKGQQVYTYSLDHPGGSSTEIINLPSSVGKGMHFLQVTNGSNRFNKQILLQ